MAAANDVSNCIACIGTSLLFNPPPNRPEPNQHTGRNVNHLRGRHPPGCLSKLNQWCRLNPPPQTVSATAISLGSGASQADPDAAATCKQQQRKKHQREHAPAVVTCSTDARHDISISQCIPHCIALAGPPPYCWTNHRQCCTVF